VIAPDNFPSPAPTVAEPSGKWALFDRNRTHAQRQRTPLLDGPKLLDRRRAGDDWLAMADRVDRETADLIGSMWWRQQ
jgi:hypothetical protein